MANTLERHQAQARSNPQAPNRRQPASSRGNSRIYILHRLAREGLSEIAARVNAGDITAAAAALEAGFKKTSPPLAKIRRLARKCSDADIRILIVELQWRLATRGGRAS